MSDIPAIEFDSVSFSYSAKHLPPVIKGINLRIPEGDFVALIGQNGAGKTTLAKHVNGIYKPTHGTVRVKGTDTRNFKRGRLARIVGYCYQNPDHQIFSQTVETEVGYGPHAMGLSHEEVQKRVDDALMLVGLDDKRGLHPSLLGRGERQRLAVASILSMGASVLVVDEPTTGLDYAGVRRIMDLLQKWNRELNVTVVVITHDIPVVADYVPRTILMAHGDIVKDGPTAEVLNDSEAIKEASVRAPQINRVAKRLGMTDATHPIVTIAEFVERTIILSQSVTRAYGNTGGNGAVRL